MAVDDKDQELYSVLTHNLAGRLEEFYNYTTLHSLHYNRIVWGGGGGGVSKSFTTLHSLHYNRLGGVSESFTTLHSLHYKLGGGGVRDSMSFTTLPHKQIQTKNG